MVPDGQGSCNGPLNNQAACTAVCIAIKEMAPGGDLPLSPSHSQAHAEFHTAHRHQPAPSPDQTKLAAVDLEKEAHEAEEKDEAENLVAKVVGSGNLFEGGREPGVDVVDVVLHLLQVTLEGGQEVPLQHHLVAHSPGLGVKPVHHRPDLAHQLVLRGVARLQLLHPPLLLRRHLLLLYLRACGARPTRLGLEKRQQGDRAGFTIFLLLLQRGGFGLTSNGRQKQKAVPGVRVGTYRLLREICLEVSK